jgi:hypothetical protein
MSINLVAVLCHWIRATGGPLTWVAQFQRQDLGRYMAPLCQLI